MAFTTFANASKLCMDFTWNTIVVTVCIHWQKTSPTPADFQLLADTFGASWVTNMLPIQVTELAGGLVTAYDLSAEGAPKYEYSGAVGVVGGASVGGVPNNTAAVISHRTASTGRSGRGRTYLPGVSETNVTNGVLTVAAAAAYLAAWVAIVLATEATGWDLVVAQRFSNNVQLAVGVTRPVTTELLALKLGTQRRRQAG